MHWKGLEKNDTTGGMSTSRIQMVIWTILHQKKPRVIKEMATSKYGVENVPDEPEYLMPKQIGY